MLGQRLLLLGILVLTGCASAPDKEFVAPVFPPPPETPRFIYERSLISSADVEVLSSAEKFKMFATGISRNARGLSKPFGIAVHRGRVYVTDTIQNAVVMFDIPGKQYKTFGNEGPGSLSKPLGIDVASNGEVYVVDSQAKRIAVYSPDGTYLRSIASDEYLQRPSGVAVNRDGTHLYVVDTGGVSSDKHRVQLFDALTGEFIKTIGKRGKEPGDFNLPLLASVSDSGDLYVMDSGNFRVQQFNPEGEFQLSFGQVGRNLGDFARPKGIDIDHDGNIYVVDTSFGNFQIFNDQGQLLMFIGERGEGNEPAKYILPADIEVDEDGRIYVVEQYFRRIDIFRPYGLGQEEGSAGFKPDK